NGSVTAPMPEASLPARHAPPCRFSSCCSPAPTSPVSVAPRQDTGQAHGRASEIHEIGCCAASRGARLPPPERRRRDMGRTALRYAFAALVIVAAAGGAVPRLHAQSADALATGIAAIPPAVEDARLFGAWEREGRSGVYRVVIARTG